MNKGFETLEMLSKDIRYKKEHIRDDLYRLYIKKNEIELLENYLIELEQIKNAKPSEVLEFIKMLLNASNSEKHLLNLSSQDIKFELIKIEQALLKAQEQKRKMLN